jgi:hypothetical protein
LATRLETGTDRRTGLCLGVPALDSSQSTGLVSQASVGLWLVPHALELCHPGLESPSPARCPRLGGNDTALVAP